MCEVGNVQKSVKKKEKPDRLPKYLRKERNQRQGMALTALCVQAEPDRRTNGRKNEFCRVL